MRRFYQAVVDIVRGGVHPREVALAVALGLLAGFLSGWNLCLAVVLVLVLLLNVPTKVFGEAWALGWAASWAATPLSFAVGRWLLEKSPLGSALSQWRDHALLALFDLDRYTLVGGGAIALALALPAAWLAAKVTRVLQVRFQQIQAAIEANAPWHGSMIVRLGCWLIFGDAARPAPAMAVNPAWIRRRGVWLTAVVLVPAGVLGWFCAGDVAANQLLATLSAANQSEVNAARVRLSFSEGLLEMEDLQVSDPDQPDRDRFRIGYVAAQVHAGALLRGRMRVERLMLENVACDVARQTRARPYGLRLPDFDASAAKDLLPEGKLLDGIEPIELAEYLSDWETLRDRLARLQDLLGKIQELSGEESNDDDSDYDPAASAPASYLAMREARHSFGRPEPKVWIQLAAIKGLAAPLGLGSTGSIELVNISSQPERTGQPTVVAIRSPEARAELIATLNLHQRGAHHDLRFQATGIDLARLVQSKSPRQPLVLQSGVIDIAGWGWLTSREFEMNLQASLSDLRVQTVSQRPVAGLSPQLWNDGFAQLDHLSTDGRLYGRWTSPKLHLNSQRLVQQFKQQLLAAGQAMLVKAIDEQLARGEAALDQVVDQSLAKAEAAVERQAEKVEAAVDRAADRAEQVADRAAGKVDALATKAEGQAAEVAQRAQQSAAGLQSVADRTQSQVHQAQQGLEQAATQASQSVQNWQNQIGAAGRFLQENVAASALTVPGPQPNLPGSGTMAEEPASRRGAPPQLLYGDILGPDGVETLTPQQPQTVAETPASATPPSDGLRYPDAVRNYAAPAAAAVAGTLAGPRYQSVPQPTQPASPMVPSAQVPPAAAMPQANRPASFNGPPAPLELGYDSRQLPTLPESQRMPPQSHPMSPERFATRNLPGNPSAQLPVVNGPVSGTAGRTVADPPRSPYTESADAWNNPTGEADAAPANGSRLANWSRNMTDKVKGLVPWPGKNDGAEATVSDSPITPYGQDTARAAAPAAELENPPVDTPWYRRFWR